ncbi:MAG: Lrp/AsnC family transcriptional regulator [Magnetovibrio sp.]|nr:Lrp/AsnC family transcriptional regulator [Magnetovibrio sp.]
MIKLDAIDLKILAILQGDGRMTKVKLAEAVHLSVSPCWERLRRLEREGVISGYKTEIDLSKLAQAAMVWVEISLRHHSQGDFINFEKHISTIPEIIECWAVGGTIDYLMRIVSPNMEKYQELIEALLGADIGIDHYVTCVVTKIVKKPGPLPLDSLISRSPKRK